MNRWITSVPSAADVNLTAAERTGGIEPGTVVHQHAIAGDHDLAAAGVGARNIECAGGACQSGVAAVEDNMAVVILQRVRLQNAIIVDDGSKQRVGTLSGHQDTPAIG